MTINAATVLEFLRNAVLELKDIEPEDITADTELASIDLESLDYVDIQVNIQKNYKIAILSDVFVSGRVKTIGQLADYIVSESTKRAEIEVAAA